MSTSTPGSDVPFRRIDRLLTFMSLGIVVLSILCFFAIVFGSTADADMTSGIWPAIAAIPLIALPLAFLLILTVLIMTFMRRARANRAR